jgi:hypothetical protein
MLMCLLLGDYELGMLLDAEKIQRGILLNVLASQYIEGFNAALAV